MCLHVNVLNSYMPHHSFSVKKHRKCSNPPNQLQITRNLVLLAWKRFCYCWKCYLIVNVPAKYICFSLYMPHHSFSVKKHRKCSNPPNQLQITRNLVLLAWKRFCYCWKCYLIVNVPAKYICFSLCFILYIVSLSKRAMVL